jgi:hypothetical protein
MESALTCSIASLNEALRSCLGPEGEARRSKMAARMRLWAESTGDATGRPGQFPAELLDLSAFRGRFELTDEETRCLKISICRVEES